jgi:hypothetical protein
MFNSLANRIVLTSLLTLLLVSQPLFAFACPFCPNIGQTFSEEMDSMDVVVIAKMISAPKLPADSLLTGDGEIPKAKFEIVDVIKGKQYVKVTEVEALYFGDGSKGDSFLLMAVEPPDLLWSTPLKVTSGAREYLLKLLNLPKEGTERLKFFQNHLEHEDEFLARDAYDEFAKAPYDAIKSLRSAMNHDQLIAWIDDAQIPASRRRLYLTMLSVCGTSADLPYLEELITSTDRKRKAGLDAMIACYVTLKGPEALPLVEELFLKNKKAEYADTYQAIMALRFHASETDIVPKERLVKAFHHMLDRPPLADLIIPDLARAEDWSQVKKLVSLFKTADDKSSWVRVPVIHYLRVCPLPEAKTYLKELEKVDPAAFRRANTFLPEGAQDTEESDQTSLTPPTVPGDEGEQVALVAPTGVDKQTKRSSAPSIDSARPSMTTFYVIAVLVCCSFIISTFLLGRKKQTASES